MNEAKKIGLYCIGILLIIAISFFVGRCSSQRVGYTSKEDGTRIDQLSAIIDRMESIDKQQRAIIYKYRSSVNEYIATINRLNGELRKELERERQLKQRFEENYSLFKGVFEDLQGSLNQ